MSKSNASRGLLTGLIFLISFILYVSCSKSGDDPIDTPDTYTFYKYPVTVPDQGNATVKGYKNGTNIDTKTTDPTTFKAELVYKVLNTSSQATNLMGKSASTTGKESLGPGDLDSIVATKPGFIRTVFKNVQPGTPVVLPIIEDPLYEAANIGIELVKGGPYVNGAQVTLSKVGDIDWVYSINSTADEPTQLAYFENIYAPISDGTTRYEVKVTSLLSDAEFPEKRDTITVPRGETTIIPFNIEDYADQHTITVVAREAFSFTKLQNAIIEMLDAQTNQVRETKSSNENGEATFVINEGDDVYFSNKYQDNYKITNGIYESPDDIQLASDIADTLNVISYPKIEYFAVSGMPANITIPADKINLYKPVAINTPQIRGEEYLYVPAGPTRDEIIQETTVFKQSIAVLGTTYTTTPFPILAVGDPLYDNYTAKVGEANTFPGQIGSNIEFSGSETLIGTKMDDNVLITFFTKVLQYTGNNIPILQKESGTSSGFPEISQNTTGWPTSRDPGSPSNVFDSPGDIPIMKTWNYTSGDFYSNGNVNGPFVYRPVTKFDD